MQQPLDFLAGDTRTFDTLYQEFLAEEEHNYQRDHNKQTAGISDSRGIQVPTCVTIIMLAERLRDGAVNVGHKHRLVCSKEQSRVEIISPLPREREQEYSYHHRYGQGKDDSHEGAQNSRAIYVC